MSMVHIHEDMSLHHRPRDFLGALDARAATAMQLRLPPNFASLPPVVPRSDILMHTDDSQPDSTYRFLPKAKFELALSAWNDMLGTLVEQFQLHVPRNDTNSWLDVPLPSILHTNQGGDDTTLQAELEQTLSKYQNIWFPVTCTLDFPRSPWQIRQETNLQDRSQLLTLTAKDASPIRFVQSAFIQTPTFAIILEYIVVNDMTLVHPGLLHVDSFEMHNHFVISHARTWSDYLKHSHMNKNQLGRQFMQRMRLNDYVASSIEDFPSYIRSAKDMEIYRQMVALSHPRQNPQHTRKNISSIAWPIDESWVYNTVLSKIVRLLQLSKP